MNPDIHIRDNVQRELFYAQELNPARVGVSVEDGIVTLTGTLDNHVQKLVAIHAAERTQGVRAVACALEVRLPNLRFPTDAALAHAAANVLAWNESVPPGRLRISVENGWVTLRGSLDTPAQRDAATSAVAGLAGVNGVDNLVGVRPLLEAEDIKEKMDDALRRSPNIEDRNILVEVNHDRVVLHGEVRSIGEREEAEQIAWSTPGVSDVANHILVASPVSSNS